METNQAPKNKTRSRDAGKMRRKIEKDLQARKKTGDESQRSTANSEVRLSVLHVELIGSQAVKADLQHEFFIWLWVLATILLEKTLFCHKWDEIINNFEIETIAWSTDVINPRVLISAYIVARVDVYHENCLKRSFQKFVCSHCSVVPSLLTT